MSSASIRYSMPPLMQPKNSTSNTDKMMSLVINEPSRQDDAHLWIVEDLQNVRLQLRSQFEKIRILEEQVGILLQLNRTKTVEQENALKSFTAKRQPSVGLNILKTRSHSSSRGTPASSQVDSLSHLSWNDKESTSLKRPTNSEQPSLVKASRKEDMPPPTQRQSSAAPIGAEVRGQAEGIPARKPANLKRASSMYAGQKHEDFNESPLREMFLRDDATAVSEVTEVFPADHQPMPLASVTGRGNPAADLTPSLEGFPHRQEKAPRLPPNRAEPPPVEVGDSKPSLPLPARAVEQTPSTSPYHSNLFSMIGSVAEQTIMEESDDQLMSMERSEESILRDSSSANSSSPSPAEPTTRVQDTDTENKETRVSAGTLQSPGYTLRSLPREIGFDDDDSSRSSFPNQIAAYYVESKELRDAFNLWGSYTGMVDPVTHLPNGKGEMVYHLAGRRYTGGWVKGHWHGNGTICNADGDVYVGDIVNDLKEGDGKLMYADGRVLVGKFKDDSPLDGTITFTDGSKYEGQMWKGTRRGRGCYYFADSSYYEGNFENDNFHGEGIMTWADGGYYSGSWVNGSMHGQGKEVLPDGSLRHEGQWKAGSPVRNKT